MSPSIERDVLSFLAALGIAAAGTPLAIRVARRVGLMDRPAPHKFHDHATPYLGGLALAAAVLGTIVSASISQPNVSRKLLAVGAGAVLVTSIGLVDDLRILGPFPRLLTQAAAALIVWAGGIRLTPTGVTALDLALTVLVVLAVTNAVNLIDNMDGLAAGSSGVAALFFAGIAAWQGQELVSMVAAAVAGACLGFLPFNFPPARIFMGDAGTLLLGFVLAATAIQVDLPGYPAITRATVAALVLWVPLFDMTLVVWSRRRGGRPVFRGGTDHASHRLVLLGLSPRRLALLTYGVGGVAGAAGVALLASRDTGIGLWAAGAAALLSLFLLVVLEDVPARRAPAAGRGPLAADAGQNAKSRPSSPIPVAPRARLRTRAVTLRESR